MKISDAMKEFKKLSVGTNFSVYRRDRSDFDNKRKIGGGVCLLVRNRLSYSRKNLQQTKTSAEIQAIYFVSTEYFILRLHSPIQGARHAKDV